MCDCGAVGDWYIVACPSAVAFSFSQAGPDDEYPKAYIRSMVLLANELQAISLRYRVHQNDGLRLKVGINCGAVAGAVIGSHKRFYCLYGDVVNTAARMCKYASDKIHCSAAFAASVRALSQDQVLISCTSRGSLDIKGKGQMETFDLSVPDVAGKNQFSHICDGSFSRSSLVISALSGMELGNAAVAASFRNSKCIEPKPLNLASAVRKGTSRGAVGPSDDTAEVEKTKSELKNLHVQAKLPRDRRFNLDALKATFEDQSTEAAFYEMQFRKRRPELLAGVMLHLFAVVEQLYQAHFLEYEYNFAAFGPVGEQLSEGMWKVRFVLDVHAVFTFAYCGFLAISALKSYSLLVYWDFHILALSSAFIAMSFLACHQLPALWGWLILFPACMVLLNAWIGRMSFRGACLQAVSTFSGSCLAMHFIRNFSQVAAADLVVIMFISLAGSRMANVQQRRLWRSQAAHSAEVSRLSSVLNDLLPPDIAERMLGTGIQGSLSCKQMRAAVLQLDVCNFTAISQTMSPMEVAEMMHRY